MRGLRWVSLIAVGLLSGLVATLLMVLLLLAGRTWLGISPPPEAIPDRFAPTLDIQTFFGLFGRFGGYNGLKKFGVTSVLSGMAVVGLLVGVVYALVVGRGRTVDPAGRSGVPRARRGLRFVVGAVAVLWIGTVIVLWPVLGANYRGLPPSSARIVSILGLLVAYVAYGVALIVTYRLMMPQTVVATVPEPSGQRVARRAVVAGAVGAALAVPSYLLMRRLYQRATFSYDGTPYSGPGVQPIAPNDKFYTVTKNVVDPSVDRSLWRLEVGGLVEAPATFDFDDLLAMEVAEQETTLMCISNTIGAGLFGNALWTGVPLRALLDTVRPKTGAVEVLLRAADGYTDTFAFDKAMEPTTLVAYRMNGDPLPERHGYPVRVIVPGLFGEKNVKWVTRIEVIDHDAKGFYEQQGWGPSFVIPTRSDIFGPRWTRWSGKDAFVEPFPLNRTATIRGRAFAGDRGVTRVEFSADDGETWQEARLDYSGTKLAWTFWSANWRPTASGEFRLLSRATDGTGTLQPPDQRGIAPQGATGYHRVLARVEA